MDLDKNAEKLFIDMKNEFAAMGINLELPHQSGKILETIYTKIDSEKSITAMFKFNPQFSNPLRRTQGGIICAMIDEVCGPLSFMIAKRPAVTIDLNTTYIRAFEEKDEFVLVTGELVSKSKSLLVMKAEVKTKDGKLIAVATSHTMILSDEQLSRKGA